MADTRILGLAFRLASAGAVTSAAIHLAGLTIPAFAAAAYPGYPAWRHCVFIAINVTAAWLFQRRPVWFVWAFAVLTLQVLSSHGGSALNSWRSEGRVFWLDAAALVAVPLALCLLVADYRQRSRAL